MNKNFQIKKSIFQIRYSPDLTYYDNLFKVKSLFKHFKDWETNGLGVSLKNYEQAFSLTVKHNSILYISDNYKKTTDDKIFKLISENLSSLIDIENVTWIGYRVFCLRAVDFSYQELMDILRLKLLSDDFYSKLKNQSSSIDITLTAESGELKYRLQQRPVTKEEMPQYFKFEEENIDKNSTKIYEKLSKYYQNLPDTALFLDLNISQEFNTGNFVIENISEFNKDCYHLSSELTNQLESHIFENKLS